jgi:GR25 family glycosyltransferase involved in LPS biosynthesis
MEVPRIGYEGHDSQGLDIVVVNLAHRPDRLKVFDTNTKKGLPKYSRFRAVYVQPEDYDPKQYPIDRATYGCYESHRRIWEKVTRNTLVLEDDAKLMRDFHIPPLPRGFDLYYLGCNDRLFGAKSGPRKGFFKHPSGLKCNVHEARKVLTTHAYIISPEAAKKALKMDHYKLAVDMALWEIQGQGNSYYIRPSLFVQRADHSDIHGKWINFEGIT